MVRKFPNFRDRIRQNREACGYWESGENTLVKACGPGPRLEGGKDA
jgi:hypothetical protein